MTQWKGCHKQKAVHTSHWQTPIITFPDVLSAVMSATITERSMYIIFHHLESIAIKNHYTKHCVYKPVQEILYNIKPCDLRSSQQ